MSQPQAYACPFCLGSGTLERGVCEGCLGRGIVWPPDSNSGWTNNPPPINNDAAMRQCDTAINYAMCRQVNVGDTRMRI